MNKVFKVIWSEARNAYVVVSEIAKNHGSKSCSTKKMLAMLIATGVMTCASVAPVMAANPAPNDTQIAVGKDAKANGGDSVAIGNGAEAKAANGIAIGYKSLSGDRGWGVAIGGNTQAIGTHSVALGQTAKALEYEGIAIGHTSLSEGSGAIVIGRSTNAKGAASLAFGNDAKALNEASIAFGQGSNSSGNGSIAVGGSSEANGANSIAIGNQAITSKDNSVVIGGHTYTGTTGTGVTGVGQQTQVLGNYSAAFGMAASANVDRATAIGSYANAMAAGSVALGAGSTVSREAGVQGYDPLTGDTSANTHSVWKSTKGAVSVGGVGVTRQIINVAAGSEDADAVNVAQLKKVNEEALKHTTLSDGKNTTVVPTVEDGQTDYKVNVAGDLTDISSVANGDAKLALNGAAGTAGIVNGKGASVYMQDGYTVINSKVSFDQDGKISGVAAGINDNDAVNVGQLKAVGATANMGWNLATNGVATEATNVKPGDVVDFSGDKNISVSHDGTKVKVELNKNIDVNYVQTNALNAKYNLSVGTANENGIMPFFVNSNGAFYGANNNFSVDKDGKVTATEGKIGNVVLKNGVLYKNTALRDGELYVGDADGNYSQITPKSAKLGQVTIDEKGNMAGVNSIQTNALNAKYNLSVGTANENGIMPFFVNSNGAFYGANNNFSVDKDGKVTATEGKIGNVVLKNGVLYKNTALRDGELYVGDADGNYSQITPKSAKLGQVTIDEKGNMAGVNSIQTNALNAKYNLSVGTANENGIMPFFVNSNGAFYGANNNFSVDKDGKVTATAGEIGNVVLDNGVFTGHSALRDGELFVGDASGNYSQITTKGAKLGKVTVAEDGKISGVAAGAVTADSTDAVNGSQLHAVATEAGKHSKVVSGNNINVEETDVDGQKFYKVNMNKDIMLGDLTGKNVSISGTNGTIEATGAIVTKDRVYADNGAKLADIDVTDDKISNGASSIVLDGSNVKVNDKVTFDQNGNIAGVNSIQTNALNAKYNLSVGTANENGIMPFFVNSNGAFYGANNNFSVDKDGKVTATAGEIGNVVLDNGVFTGHSALRDGELFVGDASGNYSQITTKGAKLGKVTVAEDGKISGVAAGAVTADSTDAVNGSQLHAVATEAGKHSKVVSGNNINVEETDVDGQKFYKVNMNKDIMLGDLTGKNVSISGTNGTIEATGAIATKDRVHADNGAKLADIDVTGNKISNGASSIVLDGSNVKVNDKVTIDQDGKISGVAAGEISSTSTDAINGSQLKETNDRVAANETAIKNNTEAISKLDGRVTANETAIKNNADAIGNLNTRVDGVEKLAKQHTTVAAAGDNITVTEDTNKDGGKEYKVALDKDINLDSVTTGQTVMNNDGLKVGKDVSVTATAVTAGQTSISNDGLKVNGKTYVSDSGLNANDQKITKVADGDISETSKDAVNGSQLYKTNQEVANNATNISSLSHSISNLDNRVNKVGAGAAALAALHPLDFDPDAKWDFAAGYGNYRGANAAAVGAYYRPNEDTMFSVGGTFGNGENMVNAGVSFKLGSGSSHVSTSRVAMAKEIKELRGELEAMKSAMLDANAGKKIDTSKLQLFPDVPQNHWAYEYVAQLAGNGMIEGYPDGNFAGDRPMTRYEFAAILYRAMAKGAVLSDKILSEFSHELEYFTVDTIAKDKAGNPTIQRVRTVKENKNK